MYLPTEIHGVKMHAPAASREELPGYLAGK